MMNSKVLCCSYCHAEEREVTDIGCYLFETVVKGALRKKALSEWVPIQAQT